MLDLQPLSSLLGQVRAPSYDALLETARRRQRRAVLLGTVGSAAVVLALAVGALVVTHSADNAAPDPVISPTPTPTPTRPAPSPSPSPTHHSETSMTPREVVQAADHVGLVYTGVSADDSDFRLSFWQAECTWCPRVGDSRFPHPSFRGLAITDDGFATATYLRPSMLVAEEGDLLPGHVLSPGPGLLLIVDSANSGEWLVRDDGSITRLARVSGTARATDPRMWFACLTDTDSPPGVNPATPADTWCWLDPEANLVHVMDTSWNGLNEIGYDTRSVVPPGSDGEPWGLHNVALDRLDGWWEAGGTRHVKGFGTGGANGAIFNGPAGRISYWLRPTGSPTLRVFSSDDRGSSWQTWTVPVPVPRMDAYSFDLSWTPGGALLVRHDNLNHAGTLNRVRIWRSPTGTGAFTLVHDAASPGQPDGYGDPMPIQLIGNRIWSRGISSDDDGRTWTEVTDWR